MTVWFSIFFLAVAVLALLWRLVDPPPRLEIGERGILQRGGWGWIPWEEIEGAYPPTAREAETVRLRLTVTGRLARILRKKRHLPRETPVEGSVEVLREIQRLYHILYVSARPRFTLEKTRMWLDENGYPRVLYFAWERASPTVSEVMMGSRG